MEAVHDLPVPRAPGNRKTKNTRYIGSCKLCHKPYIRGTVQTVNERMSGHRKNFYRVLSNEDVDQTRDDFSHGLYLINDHNSVEKDDFNRHLRVQISELF